MFIWRDKDNANQSDQPKVVTEQDIPTDLEVTIPVDGGEEKVKFGDLKTKFGPGGIHFTRKSTALAQVSKKYGFELGPDADPNQVEQAILNGIERTLKTTEAGKSLLKNMYTETFGEPTTRKEEIKQEAALKQIEAGTIPEELGTALGTKENVAALANFIIKAIGPVKTQDIDVKELSNTISANVAKSVKTEIQNEQLSTTAQRQLSGLEKELKLELPPTLKAALLVAHSNYKGDLTVKEVYEKEFVPILKKMAGDKPLSPEEKAKLEGNALANANANIPTTPTAGGGNAPSDKPEISYDNLYKKLSKLGVNTLRLAAHNDNLFKQNKT